LNQLAKQYHPDKNKSAGAAEKFQEISEAYEVCFVVVVVVFFSVSKDSFVSLWPSPLSTHEGNYSA